MKSLKLKNSKALRALLALVCIAAVFAITARVVIRVKYGVPAETFKAHEGEAIWPKAAPVPDTFQLTPEDNTYEERRARYLRVSAKTAPGGITNGIIAVRQGVLPNIDEAAVAEAVKRLEEREDCADFRLIEVIRALYENGISPVLTPDQYARLKKAVLGFKYWIDEPGDGRMIFWSENHQILFNASEYLAGRLFPDETFTNDGRNGRRHEEHAAVLIRKWIDRRARWGFSEWDSNVYYTEDLAGTLTLAEYASDKQMARLAAMVSDLLLFDIASDLFRGMYATSHGRSYTAEITSARNDNVLGVVNLVWGFGPPARLHNMDAAMLALSRRYRPPAAIVAAGRATPDEFTNFERHGIPLEDAPALGMRYDDPEELPAFWGMGAFSQPQIAVRTLEGFNRRRLWNHPFAGEAPEFLKRVKPRAWMSIPMRLFNIETERIFLGEVNKVSFRTPDYALSSAQDYRPGRPGSQQHIWQATLSPDAVVFTTNPGSPDAAGDRTPTYWNGQNRFPRVAQYKNALIAIYKLDNYPIIGQRYFYAYTHAFFPKWAFDRVETEGKWTFGQAGDAYIALYSHAPAKWTESGRDAGVELVAPGRRNVWICVLGRREADGSLDRFKADIIEAPLRINGLRVTFDAPGIGNLKFGWKGEFSLDGRRIPLSHFKRFDNPFCQADFNKPTFIIQAGGSRLALNFTKIYRKAD